jgi:uncharacterized protein with HEPN domain
MQRRDRIILQKIISEIDIGKEMTDSLSVEEFLQNEILKRAVAMTVINIGELIKNVTDELRESHTEVAWKAVAGMRDITAHKYQTLRMEDVYNTVVYDFEELKVQLSDILETDANIDTH